jgi:hypothetical protein
MPLMPRSFAFRRSAVSHGSAPEGPVPNAADTRPAEGSDFSQPDVPPFSVAPVFGVRGLI